MTINRTAQHYDSLRDGVEHASDPKPYTDEGVWARQRAINEGRLRVVHDEEPGGGREEVCVGCAAQPPLIDGATMALQLGGPTYEAIFNPGAVALTATNELGYSVVLSLLGVTLDQLGGTCKKDGGTGPCVPGTDCGFLFEILFSISIKAPEGSSSPTVPNLLLNSPATGLPLAALPPTTGTTVTAGSETTASYLLQLSTSLACGTSAQINLTLASIVLGPVTGSWSNKSYKGDPTTIQIECGSCANGGNF